MEMQKGVYLQLLRVIKMKICMVTPSFFPITGGTEVAIYEVAARLIKQEHEIILITRRLGDMNKRENIEGIEVHRVFAPDNPLGILPLQFSLFSKLKDVVKTCDLIHQFHPYHMGFATILTKKILKKPLVLSLMGWDTYDPIRPVPKILYPYLALVMNSSDMITSPSQDLANHAREQGCKKDIEIIPHGIDIDKFNPNNDGIEIRRRLGDKDDEIVALSIQRLYPRKKMEYLISAIAKVVKKDLNVKFVIGGEGPESEKLENLAKELNIDNIIFTGFISDKELPKFYSTCDIFVLHSTYEAFGIVLVEAGAMGKPIVATTVGAVPEVVEDGKTGLLVPPMDSEALADAILKLAENKKLREEMGKKGREKAIKKYDWSGITEKYLDIYKKLAR